MDKVIESNGQAMADLQKLTKRLNLMLDACDRMLRDIDDPSQYDLGLRAEEIPVTYESTNSEGRLCRRKSSLSELLAKIQGEGEVRIALSRPPDPRNLLLHTCHELRMTATACVQLMEKMTELDELEELKNTLLNILNYVNDSVKKETINQLQHR